MDILHSMLFYIIAGIAVFSALLVIFAPRIIHSAVSLLVTFLSVAGIYIMLNADFVGLAQVLIYAVGIAIIIIFAIMLTSYKDDKSLWIAFAPRSIISAGFAFCLFVMIFASITANFSNITEKTGIFRIQKPSIETIKVIQEEGTTKTIGKNLFTKYVLPFEFLSILLLVLTVGAVVLAKKETEITSIQEEV